MKKVFIGLIAALFVFGFGSSAIAFHAGGVAHCNGCHTMHNSEDGATNTVNGQVSVGEGINSNLTKGTDPSSTCLDCHLNIYKAASTDGSVFTPGGDFYWLTRGDIPTDTRGGIATAESHGHNIVAADFPGFDVVDPVLANAPARGVLGYPAASLGCNSCHDPHGQKDNGVNPFPIADSGSYGDANPNDNSGQVLGPETVLGNFRLLGGVGYDGGGVSGVNFAAGDPVAVSYHGVYGQWPAETDTNHTDYGSGMSEWCANCHVGFTADGSSSHRHPSSNDAHLNGFSAVYNSYITSGNLTRVDPAVAFDRLVPFERGVIDTNNDGEADDFTNLFAANTNGTDTNSNVMCLTCHRAHATAWPDSLKWDPDEELIAHSAALADPLFAAQAYYGDDVAVRYSDYQRSLCNKCHAQD